MSKIKMLFCSLLCLNLAFAQVQNMKKDDFFKAVKESNIDKIQYFLEGGFDINAKDERGRNAILIATYKDDVKLVKFLYQNGGDVNDRDENLNSAFLYAGANGKLEILKIIHKKAKVNSVFNRFGGNALIPACEKGHFETAKFLLENTDINVNHVNNLSWTALLEVLILGDGSKKYVDITRLLLEHKADKNIKDNQGKTAIDYAKERGFKEIEKLFR
ncbi:ankyrin repeat domain-containing protein [uncultured Campylobacter sp.]|uniref:ankyrin repeat domain-containing protein n=1 Tax=uncultured Campylobacter sp. TaxID=218934 RepID=UPI00263011BB|nr:ankyrin repeat domain-containing protein [uncultured Campylobacter sp.]